MTGSGDKAKRACRQNEEITEATVFLVDRKKELTLQEALAMARTEGADLVEVKPGEIPPCCAIKRSVQRKEKLALSPESVPMPLARALEECRKEEQPFRKVHRLIDAIEVLVKLHTVTIVSDYFRRENVADDMKGLLGAGLKTPSLGIWWQFARDICKAQKVAFGSFHVPGIEEYVMAGGGLFMAMESQDNLISFRNSYAHGATPSDDRCRQDIERYGKVMDRLIANAGHWTNTKLVAVKKDGSSIEAVGVHPMPVMTPEGVDPGKCYLVTSGKEPLSLYPLLVYQEDSEKFFFYNDMRSNDASILNYESCLHERAGWVRDAVLKEYPIHEWGRRAPQEFIEDIERLTEVFKGRRVALNRIIDFVCNNRRGFLMIWGGPGMGKSALLARAFQVLKWTPADRQRECLNSAEGLGKVTVLEYFIRRSAKTDNITSILDNLSSRIEQNFKTGVPMGGDVKDKYSRLKERLCSVRDRLGDNDRLILLIDGLDEGADKPDILDNLPTEVPDKVIVVYASRDNPAVREGVYNRLEREHHQDEVLGGLDPDDIRALLSDCVNKYDINTDYIRDIVERSGGSPLFLKMLCEGLEKDDYRLNDSASLPKELREIYATVMERFGKSDSACDFIRLLAVAKEPISCETIASMMGLPLDKVETSRKMCMEVLFENPLTEDIEDYQLFHETMREFIYGKYPGECRKWELHLADWCRNWRDMEGSSREYALRWLVPHACGKMKYLLKEEKREDAVELSTFVADTLDDKSYRDAVFVVCGNATTLQRDFISAQRLLATEDRDGSNMMRIFRFARMYHEEATNLYVRQMEKLTEYAVKRDFDRILQTARMGDSTQAKVMIALRGLWQIPSEMRLIPVNFRHDVENWLEQASNPELARLWKKCREVE